MARRQVSIRLKLIAVSTVLLVVVVGLFGFLNNEQSRRIIDDSSRRLQQKTTEALRNAGTAQLRLLAQTTRIAVAQSDYSTLQTTILDIGRRDKRVTVAAAVDPQGTVLAHTNPALAGQPARGVLQKSVSGEKVQYFPDVTVEGRRSMAFGLAVMLKKTRLCTVFLAYNLEPLQAELVSMAEVKRRELTANLRDTLIVGLLAVLLGVLLVIILGISLTSPIHALAKHADRMAKGDLGARVQIRANDEIGFLGERFNFMSEQIMMLMREALQKNEQLRELDRQKTTFFQNTSHELRTPLTLLLNPLETLINADLSQQPQAVIKEKLRAMERNTHRLLRLVNQLLDLSRLEARGVKVVFEERDVEELVRGIVKGFEPFARSKGLSLEIRGGNGSLPRAFVDPEKVDKIVCNLLSNACKFTERGGSVVVRLAAEKGALTVAVIDTGIGISAADQKKIFERFRQVDDGVARSYEGTGIGLAIAKELSHAVGGELDVESEPGVGSKFILTLPVGTDHIESTSMIREPSEAQESAMARAAAKALAAEVELKQPPGEGEKKAEGKPAAAKERPLVLVVEDNPDMRSLVAEICSADFEVVEAANGEEGLYLAQQRPPTLVISDIMMPRVDGYQLLQAMRAEPALAGIPVILLTAKAGQEQLVHGLEIGADDYVAKPFSSRELQARARNLVRLKQQEQELRKLNTTLQQEVVNQSSALQRAQRLGRFLPPGVVKLVMEEGQDVTVRQRKRLTVFRMELRGFGEMVDVVEPEEMAAMLNSYLSKMTEVAFSHGATIDKIVRDTLMGFFGAPESAGVRGDASRAVKMAIELWQQAAKLSEGWRDLLEAPPPLPTVLLTSGYATVGSFGSNSRLEYTAVGGPVEEVDRLMRVVGPGQVVCTHGIWKVVADDFKEERCGELIVGTGSKKFKLYRLAGPLTTGDTIDDTAQMASLAAAMGGGNARREESDAGGSASGEISSERSPGSLTGTGEGRLEIDSVLAERFQILRRLGEGAMGIVYKARDLKLGADVALKLVRHEYGRDSQRMARVYREVKLARLISHPNVARMYDIVEWEGREFVVMEYIRGRTLRHRLSIEGALPVPMAQDLVLQLCAGLSAAHAAGIVHRDLKPSNVMLEHGGRVVVLDFGIAKWFSPFDEDRTETRETLGTPHYMAPEQFENKEIDPRTDVYSLGVLMFEALTGQKPYLADTAFSCAYRHINDPVPDPQTLRPDVSARLAAVVVKCMQKAPKDRFNSVSEIVHMLPAPPEIIEELVPPPAVSSKGN